MHHFIRRGDGARINHKLYKTELCRSWQQTNGQCGYGDRCQYAHGAADLRNISRHPKYKTEPCQSFLCHGVCNYGSRCHFIHDEYDHNGPAEYSFVQAPMHMSGNLNWQQLYTPSYYYPMVVQGPVVVGKQVASQSASADSGCESGGADSPVGSESGDRAPFTAGFMDPKLFIRARSPAHGDFSPFDKKHEILENLFNDSDVVTSKKQNRLPVFAHLSPSKP